MKQGGQFFDKYYFEKLLERIRKIRAYERRFYQKFTDIYAQCNIDYDENSETTQNFTKLFKTNFIGQVQEIQLLKSLKEEQMLTILIWA